VPELRDHEAALVVNGVDDAEPAVDLGFSEDAGGAVPAAGAGRDGGGLGDDEASVGGALRVVLEHEIAGDIAGLLGPRARERGHDDSMAEVEGDKIDGGEESLRSDWHGESSREGLRTG